MHAAHTHLLVEQIDRQLGRCMGPQGGEATTGGVAEVVSASLRSSWERIPRSSSGAGRELLCKLHEIGRWWELSRREVPDFQAGLCPCKGAHLGVAVLIIFCFIASAKCNKEAAERCATVGARKGRRREKMCVAHYPHTTKCVWLCPQPSRQRAEY